MINQNYYPEWWENARNHTGTILTKPVYTKQLEAKLQELQSRKKGQLFKKLEQENSTLKIQLANIQQVFQTQVKNSVDLAEENQNKDQVITSLQVIIQDKEQQLANIEDVWKERLKVKERELANSKVNSKELVIINTQWKSKFQQQAQQKEQQLRKQLQTQTELVNDLAVKDQENQVRINHLETQLVNFQTQQAEKEKAGEKAFKEIINSITTSKTFILTDWRKKKIKDKFDRLKAIFRWDQVETDISEDTSTP